MEGQAEEEGREKKDVRRGERTEDDAVGVDYCLAEYDGCHTQPRCPESQVCSKVELSKPAQPGPLRRRAQKRVS